MGVKHFETLLDHGSFDLRRKHAVRERPLLGKIIPHVLKLRVQRPLRLDKVVFGFGRTLVLSAEIIELLRRLRGHGLAGPAPFVQQLRQTIVNRAVHLVLRLEIGQREHRTARRHDPRLGIHQRLEPQQAADDAADPAAGGVVDNGPAFAVDSVADREHVLFREVHVEIAVGVARDDDRRAGGRRRLRGVRSPARRVAGPIGASYGRRHTPTWRRPHPHAHAEA
jgi:hypothetical protein